MPTRELSSTPNLVSLFGKAALANFTRRGGGGGATLPDTAYEQAGITIDPAHLAAYNRLCEFRLSDDLPITYPHMFAFPLQVKLMTDDDFPFPLIGSVHLANRITQGRPLRVGDTLDVKVRAENLRPHDKGQQFDMISEVFVDGKPIWVEQSTYLRRGGSSASNGKPAEKEERPPAPEPTAIWRVPDDIGRRYAKVSGDHNPIHLHPLTAKALGFPKAIAHGMWTKARSLAAFEGRLPAACSVDVKFKTPVLLPAKVGFITEHADDGWTFQLFDARKGKPHLEGTITAG
ncbi:acyl dehydratase [Herbihabitans rhizosphaerae]|uniref:Acyl dehydratase n=1 Tax=Herbihabitans rhizosphaerae TaxID=1872711 RepID=A0A4Q7KM78_9PSEU|nr:MaoC/PaaZ C-terminal domain-containing protein [Herbihabitans rhizosphaerae]RZS37778.1 acyl dehydratase [Herbihabitans rhizosphaerae]